MSRPDQIRVRSLNRQDSNPSLLPTADFSTIYQTITVQTVSIAYFCPTITAIVASARQRVVVQLWWLLCIRTSCRCYPLWNIDCRYSNLVTCHFWVHTKYSHIIYRIVLAIYNHWGISKSTCRWRLLLSKTGQRACQQRDEVGLGII